MRKFHLKKISHLTRYFIVVSALIFAGHINHWHDNIFLLLIGPVLYLTDTLKKLILFTGWDLPSTERVKFYLFLLPLTFLYFGLVGFQIKKLYNEKGLTRFVSLFAFLLFLLFIHYTAWKTLTGYFALPPSL